MKITNLVLAALMIVAAPTFANQAVSKAATEGVTSMVRSMTPTQLSSAAVKIGLPASANSAAVTAQILKSLEAGINSGNIKESQLFDSRSKVVRQDLVLAAVNASTQSKLPVGSSSKVNPTDTRSLDQNGNQVRNGGSDIGSISGEQQRGSDDDVRLSDSLNRCTADGKSGPVTGVCGKLKDAAATTWKALSSKIVSDAASKSIATIGQVKANTFAWTKSLIESTRAYFGNISCEAAAAKIVALSDPRECAVIGQSFLDQRALSCR